MTQRTINLYDGLEALYYFDSDYFDGTTGEIKDKSGHGRHATANGSPTVGVNGPNDFEAASFSGGNSGDYFLTNTIQPPELSIFTIVKVDSGGWICDLGRPSGGAGYVSLRALTDNNGVSFRLTAGGEENNTNEEYETGYNYNKGEYHRVLATFTPQTVQLSVDGDYAISTTTGYELYYEGTGGSIGAIRNGAGELSGDISVFGAWSRVLTSEENEALNRLTAPRRSQL